MTSPDTEIVRVEFTNKLIEKISIAAVYFSMEEGDRSAPSDDDFNVGAAVRFILMGGAHRVEVEDATTGERLGISQTTGVVTPKEVN
jgi:hypothetical protein